MAVALAAGWGGAEADEETIRLAQQASGCVVTVASFVAYNQ